MIPAMSMLDYSVLLKDYGDKESLRNRMFLDALSSAWIASYKSQTIRKTNINEMFFSGFSVLVDLEGSDHCDGRGPQPPGVYPRTIVAYGVSKPSKKSRDNDDQRLKGMEPTAPELGTGRDKGHFIAHSIGGEVLAAETNIFTQRRDLNRGWSAAGKAFRQMERMAAKNAGTAFFHRAIYTCELDVPDYLEVGVVRPDNTLWTEVFDNRDSNSV